MGMWLQLHTIPRLRMSGVISPYPQPGVVLNDWRTGTNSSLLLWRNAWREEFIVAKVNYIFFYIYIYTWVRASWIEFNNCPTRCDLFSLLLFCRQLYMFRVLTPIIRSSYNCNYSFWYWLTGSTTTRSRWAGTDSCLSYCRYSLNEYLPYDTHEAVPTQQRERVVVDPVNQYQKL